ncbi:uncharacterized protein LOC131677376 [Topomyia yanbarensis]|uniref:uncharacterized protein LOC131677376 n=1 Tax=Topomyia yanbarensis TaxID=2498891 RepID=UPI00273AC8C5|nr:uncharacterized protein LOC131677376 [Topomyia yanbarensis]
MAEERTKQQLLNRRTTLIASIGRAEQFVKNYLVERDAGQVSIRIEHLDTVWMGLDEVQSELENMEETNEGMAQNLQIRSHYETSYFQIKAALKSYLPLSPSTNVIPQAYSGLSAIKLPTISLPEFDGDYNQWLAFHDTFVALIHDNAEVPAIQKFHYLRAAVKGEAAQLIESIGISSANYTIAWQALVSRFANEYLLKKRHLQALLDCPRMNKESASALHSVVDVYERHTKTLRQLGEPIDAWSTMLEHLLCLRLDTGTLKAWEDFATTAENPDFNCLIDFLQRRARVLESMSVNHQAQPAPVYQPPMFRKPSFQKIVSHAAAETTHRQCHACDQHHPLFQCPQFENMSLPDRLDLVNYDRLCHNCFRQNHIARNCQSNFSCRHCKKRHHSLLHPGYYPIEDDLQPSTSHALAYPVSPIEKRNNASTVQRTVTSTNAATVQAKDQTPLSNANVLLSTVVLLVVDSNGKSHPARALLDNGSQSNIMSERLCQLLHLQRSKINIPVYGIGESSSNIHHCVRTNVQSRKCNFEIGLDFLVMPRITIDLPAVTIPANSWHIPKEFFLADPTFNKSGAIDMLLGAEHFFTFVNPGTRIDQPNNPILIDSIFGWIVSGRTISPVAVDPIACHIALSDPLQEALERFWRTEEIENKLSYSVEEQQCESHFASNVSRTREGRYVVRLPRHPNFDLMLGESKAAALRRFHYLEKRLCGSPELKAQYHSVLSEYLSLGHMRLVPENEIEPPLVHYLPHHAVLKLSSTTTKVRVVFDGSAKTSTGFSLNNALQVGPIIQDELLTLVLRFRKYPIALVADIEKMYRQVLLHPERILWRFDSHAQISTYELQTVTYGLAPSSFLATRTLQQLAADEGDCYPLGGPALCKGFYVDDYIGGAETKEEAIQTRIELDELLRKGGFILRKWTSNNADVLKDLDPSQIGTQPALKFDHDETIKTLGVSWEPATDQLRFDSTPCNECGSPTKRSILSSVSKHFDPLGLTAPVIIRAKMLLQELWLQPCGWDEEVSDNIRTKWENYCAELPSLSSYRVNRYAFLPNSTVQLHTFADASQQAYGACIYARSTDSKSRIHIQLLASKSKVAPLKQISVPRLELSAAVLAARLHKKVSAALDMPISASFFWSDSTVTLEWLRSPPYTWNTFIANRVSEIQTSTHGSHWNHVKGKRNPADLITRGIKVSDFLNCDLWHHGPTWLKLPETEWPTKTQHQKTPEDILERRRMVAAVQNKPCVNEIFKRFATYNRLIRVTAYCLRFIAACRRKLFPEQTPENSITLTVDEITAARFKLIALAQADVFAEEMRDLGKGYAISKRSDLRLLSPFVDPDGILRVGGRLKLSEQPYMTKHPILIPSSHPFTRLVAQHYHLKLLHGGGRVTLAAIRQEYWPIQGRRVVNSVMRNCFRCARAAPVPAKQQTGQLPLQRITPSRPFSVTGVDYAGPVYIKPIHKRAAPTKAYLSIFVCFVTKAVHIELVSDLSTPAFLSALRRFIARRGCPAHMHSDNGKNFEGARNELHALYQLLQKEKTTREIATHCANEGIQWHMIPPKAPHFGGLWEAAVKVAKKHLYRQLGNAMLSFEDMATVLAEIESAMNSRPLTPLTEDPNDLAVLTPAHFLIGTSQSALPDADVSQMPIGRLDHYQRLQHRAQQFWYQWKTEYLQEMQKNNKHIAPNTAFQPGRLVVVVDEFLAPVKWSLARIISTCPGPDGLTRVVELRTSKGIIRRPITKICLLPYNEE